MTMMRAPKNWIWEVAVAAASIIEEKMQEVGQE